MKIPPHMRVAAFLAAVLILSFSSRATEPSTLEQSRHEIQIGELEISVEDYAGTSRTLYFLYTGNERLPLDFGDNPPKHLRTGAFVRVNGMRGQGALKLS